MSGYRNNPVFSLLRQVYWANPGIAKFLTNFRRHIDITGSEFDIQVDGFPRSANSYAGYFVEYSQGRGIRVRKHHHLPASVIHSVRTGKPVMLLLRHPRESAVSHAIYTSSSVAEQVRFYRDYHRALRPYKQGLFVALFEEVITDMPGVLRRFDHRFNLGLRHDYDVQAVKLRSEEAVRHLDWSRTRDGEVDVRRISLPSARRDELKKARQAEVDRLVGRRIYTLALAEFEHFASLATRPAAGTYGWNLRR